MTINQKEFYVNNEISFIKKKYLKLMTGFQRAKSNKKK
jgi:hypothetical protein